MNSVYVNQVGYLLGNRKHAALNFASDGFELINEAGESVYQGKVSHFGTDEISGEDIYVADFGEYDTEGTYRISASGVTSPAFSISEKAYEPLLKDICKCLYFLRCGDALDEEHAGVYYHKPCHTSRATVYGEDTEPVDVSGGWHDAGDYGRYSTAGAVAVAHILYAVRFFPSLPDLKYDIPKVSCDKGQLPDVLAEVKVELDFLLKMQREDGSVWHKVTTFNHAPFIMPEEDTDELFLFPVSSMATADIAAVFALAYTVYDNFDHDYALRLLDASRKAYDWLKKNPEPVLFKNAPGSNTGEYGEAEDISNRFWAACALFEAAGEKGFLDDADELASALIRYDSEAELKGYQGDVFTCMGWAEVAGLGSMSLILKNNEDALTVDVKTRFIKEASRLRGNAGANGFDLCMDKKDFIWGSNMELLKYMMILTVAERIDEKCASDDLILAGVDYLLGCNTMDVSYVTGNGEKAYKNPHLRPTACDDIDDPWPGLVSGGPNTGLQDARAKIVPADSAPMKCYYDHADCYSLNEITIYWNSPFIFVLAGLRSAK